MSTMDAKTVGEVRLLVINQRTTECMTGS